MEEHVISEQLKDELREMIQNNKSFLSCFAVVQGRKNISLIDAKNLLLQSDIYSKNELQGINKANHRMMAEFVESDG